MAHSIPRLLVAAPASGGGKTTVTCGLLKALLDRGLTPAAFKCGPDYIDPMFHQSIIGAKSRNLDLFFTSEETAAGLLCRAASGADIAVIEGVMGYYDGVGGSTPQASAWHVAQATRSPVLLALSPKGASLTLAAQVRGLMEFRAPSRIAGIVLNPCSQSLYRTLSPMLERETGFKVYGYLPAMPEAALGSRHLGLVTADEVADLQDRLERIAGQMARSVDLDGLLELARSAPELDAAPPRVSRVTRSAPRIAVAWDRAFCFYYQDNLDLLEELGAELTFFSPLADRQPPLADALYLGGGYPELYAQQLSRNAEMRRFVRRAVESGVPTLAECGGFLYLGQELEDEQGAAYPMAGALPGRGFATGKLGRFGYVTLTLRQDCLLGSAGSALRGHEFHYWDSTEPGSACRAEKPVTGRGWDCVQASESLFAGFPHLSFYSNLEAARRFVLAASRWKESGRERI